MNTNSITRFDVREKKKLYHNKSLSKIHQSPCSKESQIQGSQATEDKLGSRKHQTCKANKGKGEQVLRTPSEWPPLDLNTRALHPLHTTTTIRLLRKIKACPFHPQLLNAPCHSPPIIPLPLQVPPHLPIPMDLHLHKNHKHKGGAKGHHGRKPPLVTNAMVGLGLLLGLGPRSEKEG